MRTCSMRFLKQALFLRLEKIQFLHFKYKNVLEFLLPCEHESAQNHIRGWLQALALTNEHQGSASGIRSCELLQTILRRKAGRFAKGSTLRWSGSYRRIPIGGAGWGRPGPAGRQSAEVSRAKAGQSALQLGHSEKPRRQHADPIGPLGIRLTIMKIPEKRPKLSEKSKNERKTIFHIVQDGILKKSLFRGPERHMMLIAPALPVQTRHIRWRWLRTSRVMAR